MGRKKRPAQLTYIEPHGYPPPLTEEQVKQPIVTTRDVNALVGDVNRAKDKIEQAKDSGQIDRMASAGARAVAISLRLATPATTGIKAKKAQSDRAKKPRIKVTDDGETITQIVGKLALRDDKEEIAKKLWRAFFSELDKLNPVEENHPTDLKKNKYTYDYRYDESKRKFIRRHISFGTFAKEVSAYRTGKKLL